MKNTTFLYLMVAGEYYKVGITQNLKNRISQIQNGCPIEITEVYYSQFDYKKDALEAEKKIHSLLTKSSTQGEWFINRSKSKTNIINYLRVIKKDITEMFNVYKYSKNYREMYRSIIILTSSDKALGIREKIDILNNIRNSLIKDNSDNDILVMVENRIEKFIKRLAILNFDNSNEISSLILSKTKNDLDAREHVKKYSSKTIDNKKSYAIGTRNKTIEECRVIIKRLNAKVDIATINEISLLHPSLASLSKLQINKINKRCDKAREKLNEINLDRKV